MSNNNTALTIICLAIMSLIAMAAVFAHFDKIAEAEIAKACVSAGGEWKILSWSMKHECVRP
jgi:hypothetical protein